MKKIPFEKNIGKPAKKNFGINYTSGALNKTPFPPFLPVINKKIGNKRPLPQIF